MSLPDNATVDPRESAFDDNGPLLIVDAEMLDNSIVEDDDWAKDVADAVPVDELEAGALVPIVGVDDAWSAVGLLV